MDMKSPEDWLLVVRYDDDSKGYINLWEAIESGMLKWRQGLNHTRVIDACADTPENRHDIDTAFGTKPKPPTRDNWVHHVDFEHNGFVSIHRHDGTTRSYKPSEAGLQRLRNVIDRLAWSWRPPTTLDSQSMRIKNRAIAPMRRFS